MAFRSVNFFKGTLQQSILAAATTAYIESDVAALLPALSGGDVVRCVLYDQSLDPEIIDITAQSGGTLTIVRAREGTTAQDWPAGTILTHDLTAAIVEAVAASSASGSSYAGPAVGTNAVEITITGALPVPSTGDTVSFIVDNSNTGAVTLELDNGTTSIGPTALVHTSGVALEAGDLQDGWLAKAEYNATIAKWVLISQTSDQQRAYSINDGPLVPANLLSNGAFEAWAGGTSFSDPASGSTVADGYYIEYDGTIGNFTVSRQSFTLGQTDVLGEPKYYLRWAHTSAGSGSSYRRLKTRLPGVERLAGKKGIWSVYLKADASRNVTAKLLQNFGTGGSPSSEVEVESEVWALTTSWQRFDIADTFPSISGKTLGSDGNDGVVLALELPVNTTMTIEVAMDQFEYGDTESLPGATWPTPTHRGGTGRSYADFDALVAGIEASVGGFLTQTEFNTANPDLAQIEALTGTGFPARVGSDDYEIRSFAVGTGLTISNPAGVAGNPTISLDTALTQYVADPLSVAELASITGTFGTAAFVASTTFAAASLTLTAGLGISGGGDLSTDRSFALDFSELTDVAITTSDGVTFMDVSDSNAPKRRVVSSFLSDLSIAQKNVDNSFSANQTINKSDVQFILYDAWGASDQKATLFRMVGGIFYCRTDTDALSSQANIFQVTRSGVTPGVWTFGPTVEVLLSAVGPSSIYSTGFRGLPNIAGDKSTNYTLALTDAGTCVDFTATATVTIPANSSVAFPLGTVIMLSALNGGGVLTVHPDTGVTLRRGDGTAGTGDRSVPADAGAYIRKRGTNEWYIYGIYS